MTPLQRALMEMLYSGRDEPGGYLANPASRPEINRARPPLPQQTAPAWRAQMGALPRPAQEVRPTQSWEDTIPMGPGARDAPVQPALRVGLPPARGLAADSPAAFPDAAAYLRDGLGRRPLHPVLPGREQIDLTAWRQPEQIGAGAAVSENRLPIGAEALNRGVEPPSAPTQPQGAYLSDDDAEWNAARDRVRAQLAAETRAQGRQIPRPGLPLIAQAFRTTRR